MSFNSVQHLDRCLTSLLHTVGLDCEVIVVDNASTDGSARRVRKSFPWVKLVRNRVNEGFAAATNRAAKIATGEYLVALNPDTEVTAGWLDALLKPFCKGEREGQQVGITTPRILMMAHSDRVNTCGNDMHYTGITVCRGLGYPAFAPELSVSREVSAVSGACFAMKRQVWEKLGGFDPTFFTYLEDADLSLRARLAGYRCVYVPESVVYHAYTPSFTARKLYYLERNRIMMLAKALRSSTLLRLLPSLALTEAIVWAYAVKSGPRYMLAKVKAYRWLVSHRTMLASKRRQTQSCRQVSDRMLLSATSARLDMRQLAGPGVAQLVEPVVNRLFTVLYWLAIHKAGDSSRPTRISACKHIQRLEEG